MDRPSARLAWAASAIAISISGCGVALRASRPATVPDDGLAVTEAETERCIRSVPGEASPYRAALPGPETDPALVPYLAPLPPEVRRTAAAAGLEPLLARLLRARAEADGADTLETLSLRQELGEHLAALPPQMLATEFECECEIALLADVIAEHDDREAERQLDLTIASLVVGAGSSLAAGLWDLANEQAAEPASPEGPLVTALLGAVVTTGLGVAVVVPVPRELVIEHEHNLLAPLAAGEDPGRIYPTFVLRMLTTPEADGGASPLEALRARWDTMIEEALGDHDRGLVDALLFGAGGVYDVEAARLRQALLEDLETTLDSLARHVDRLVAAIAEALAGVGSGVSAALP